MEKHTPEKRRKERIEEVMLEVCIDNSSDYVERTLLIRNGLLILIGIGGRILYVTMWLLTFIMYTQNIQSLIFHRTPMLVGKSAFEGQMHSALNLSQLKG